jgi:hypothetical protein
MRPASVMTIWLKHRSSVVFPEPLVPTNARHSPRSITSETPSSAVRAPYCFRTLSARRAGVCSVMACGVDTAEY